MGMKSKKLMFTLILIGLLTWSPGCRRASPGVLPEGDDTDTQSQETDSDTGSETESETESATETDDDICEYGTENVYEVPSFPEGVPATPEDICGTETEYAESNQAATVELTADPVDGYVASGYISIAEAVRDQMVGVPTLELVGAQPEELLAATISDITASGDGFSFDIAFPEGETMVPDYTELTTRITFEMFCDDASVETQLVESFAYVHLCEGEEHPIWVSSGGECTVCSEVCEKIASPLPSARDSALKTLAGSPRATIVPVARYGRNLILFAEYRETRGRVSYVWKASSGSISESDQAGIIWELPPDPGPHFVQVAIRDTDSAVLATLAWRHEA